MPGRRHEKRNMLYNLLDSCLDSRYESNVKSQYDCNKMK